MTIKSIQLVNALKTMDGGIRMYERDGEFYTNFNEAVNLFQLTDHNIVDLSRIKKALNKMSINDVYHPNVYISSADILKMIDLTKNSNFVEAYNNKKSEKVFRCGIVNGSYKDVIIEVFNNLIQAKVKEKIMLVISEKMNFNFSIIDDLSSLNYINKNEAMEMKKEVSVNYEDIIEQNNLELKSEIKKYRIFLEESKLLTVNSIVQNIILDTEFFQKISNINLKTIDFAKKYDLKYQVSPSFAIINDFRLAS